LATLYDIFLSATSEIIAVYLCRVLVKEKDLLQGL